MIPDDLESPDVFAASALDPAAPLSRSRRDFLGSAGAGVAALAAVALPHWPADGMPAIGGGSSAVGHRVAPPWSDAWLDKITGKHKQFFDGVNFNEGFVLAF